MIYLSVKDLEEMLVKRFKLSGVAGLRPAACLQSVAGYLGLALVFVWGSTLRGGGLIAVLGKFLASIDKIFIFAGGRWALGYHSMGFRHFPMVLGRSATRETTSTHHVYK